MSGSSETGGKGVVGTPAEELRSAMWREPAGAVGYRAVPRAALYAEFLSTSTSHEGGRVVRAGREARPHGGSVGQSAAEQGGYVQSVPRSAGLGGES